VALLHWSSLRDDAEPYLRGLSRTQRQRLYRHVPSSMLPSADSVDAQAVEAVLHLRIWNEDLAGQTWLCCTEAIFEATSNAYRGCTQVSVRHSLAQQ
jgi:hypothetical protein